LFPTIRRSLHIRPQGRFPAQAFAQNNFGAQALSCFSRTSFSRGHPVRNFCSSWTFPDCHFRRPRETAFSKKQRGQKQVPLGRYFLLAGSVLLGLLFIAERYWPASTTPSFASEARYDRSVIRVSSAHRWPERIDIDTSLPTIVPPLPAASAEDPTDARPPREAFAQLNVPTPKFPSAVRVKRKQVKRVPDMRVASYPPPMRETLPAGW
jgi:hypothetical protein